MSSPRAFQIQNHSSQVVEEALGVGEGGGAVEGRARGGEGHRVGAAHAAVVAAQGQPAATALVGRHLRQQCMMQY